MALKSKKLDQVREDVPVHHVIQEPVGGRDDLGAGLEAPLRGHDLHERLGQVDVGVLKLPRAHIAPVPQPRRADVDRARVREGDGTKFPELRSGAGRP